LELTEEPEALRRMREHPAAFEKDRETGNGMNETAKKINPQGEP